MLVYPNEKLPKLMQMKEIWPQIIRYRTFWELSIFLVIGVGSFVWLFCYPLWIMKDQDAIRNLILLTAGIVGWYFLARRTKAAEQDAATAKQNAETAEQGLTVERLTRAIEQLASENQSVRLGGILGLKQIVESHEEEREKITQILSAFIRNIAPLGPTRRTEERHKFLDVEAAVEALSSIAAPLYDEKQLFCELQETNLSGLRFYGTDLSYFVFTRANFSNTFFSGVDFEEASFEGVNISGIILEEFYGLSQEQIDEAFCWEGEQPSFPNDLKPPPSKRKPQRE